MTETNRNHDNDQPRFSPEMTRLFLRLLLIVELVGFVPSLVAPLIGRLVNQDGPFISEANYDDSMGIFDNYLEQADVDRQIYLSMPLHNYLGEELLAHLTDTDETSENILVTESDRNGGMGEYDLWLTNIEDQSVSLVEADTDNSAAISVDERFVIFRQERGGYLVRDITRVNPDYVVNTGGSFSHWSTTGFAVFEREQAYEFYDPIQQEMTYIPLYFLDVNTDVQTAILTSDKNRLFVVLYDGNLYQFGFIDLATERFTQISYSQDFSISSDARYYIHRPNNGSHILVDTQTGENMSFSYAYNVDFISQDVIKVESSTEGRQFLTLAQVFGR